MGLVQPRRIRSHPSRRHRGQRLWTLLLLSLAACEGQGSGQLEGTLFLRGCPLQGSDDLTGMPNPLPAFRLNPTFFSAEPLPSLPPTQNVDQRNRERLAYDADRKPLRDKKGQPVPADPALLNFGKLGFLSSQAHAHYGLPQLQFSDDPEVLKTDPRRFAVASSYPKGPVLTLAAEMAQEHLDLALLASLCATPEGAPAGRALTHLYTGQAFHYLEDVSNQVHTVQVGLYDFFVDAFKARLMMSLRTGGGYLGPLRSLSSIGIDILTNHHTLSEALARGASALDRTDEASLDDLLRALRDLG